jgi:hypothetical protein
LLFTIVASGGHILENTISSPFPLHRDNIGDVISGKIKKIKNRKKGGKRKSKREERLRKNSN